eukprot:2321157-Pyramimonas_sp.AAC.1
MNAASAWGSPKGWTLAPSTPPTELCRSKLCPGPSLRPPPCQDCALPALPALAPPRPLGRRLPASAAEGMPAAR